MAKSHYKGTTTYIITWPLHYKIGLAGWLFNVYVSTTTAIFSSYHRNLPRPDVTTRTRHEVSYSIWLQGRGTYQYGVPYEYMKSYCYNDKCKKLNILHFVLKTNDTTKTANIFKIVVLQSWHIFTRTRTIAMFYLKCKIVRACDFCDRYPFKGFKINSR